MTSTDIFCFFCFLSFLACGGAVSLAVPSAFATIQAAVDSASNGDVVTVASGSYTENVSIDGKDVSIAGSGATIFGVAGVGALGTITITGPTDGVTISGLHIVGFDNTAPGIETAAVYIQGMHSSVSIVDNTITANGDGGFLMEYAAAITGLTISGNQFDGKTFVGANPASGDQFTVFNVPRQLVVVQGNAGDTTGLAFSNNEITGVAGGVTTGGVEQGNTLVTLDSVGAQITGNTFRGSTQGFGNALRIRRASTELSGNTFIHDDLGETSCHIFFQEAGPTTQEIADDNAFSLAFFESGTESATTNFICWNEAVFAMPIEIPSFIINAE